MPNKIKFIDLFAGLGGIRIGFEEAAKDFGLNTECVFTSEIKESALKAYAHNFHEDIPKRDITKVDASEIPEFNVLLGGFPCQAFSFAGSQKGFADTRGTLFFEIERILKKHLKNVDGFLLENVEGLIEHQKESKSDPYGKTLKVILSVLRDELKFNTEFILLNASDFGVPQARKRVYIVGCKKKFGKIKFNFPKPTHKYVGDCIEYGKTCQSDKFFKLLLEHYNVDALEGKFLKDKRGGASNIHSWDFEYKGKVSAKQKDLLNLLFKQRRRHSWAEKIGIEWMDGMPLTMQQISTFYNDEHLQEMLDDLVEKNYLVLEHPKKKVYHTENGSTYTERVPDETLPKGYNIVTGKLSFPISHILNSKGVAPTIVAMDMNTLGVIDGQGMRHLTLKEGLRLFGYPEWYSLEEFNETNRTLRLGYDLLGNSVCVPVIKAVAKVLLSNIKKKYEED